MTEPSVSDANGLYTQDVRLWNRLIGPVLAWMDWCGVTPNLITLSRLVFVPTSAVLFFLPGHMFSGGMAWIIGMVLDGFDGPLARYQDELHQQGIKLSADKEADLTLWQRVRFRGSTALGGILDPILDKLLVAAAIIPLGRKDLFLELVYAWLGVAAALTVLSVGLWALGTPKPGANWFGKVKIWVESALVASLGLPEFVNAGYGFFAGQSSPHNILLIPAHPCVSNTILISAILFGALSFLTHLFWTFRWSRLIRFVR